MGLRPLYKREPREDLEERFETLNEIVVALVEACEEINCDCLVCQMVCGINGVMER